MVRWRYSMTSWKKPTDEEVDRAIALMMGAGEKYRYFFERLQNPEWIMPLRQRGFFRAPPEPVKHDDLVEFPAWPESAYLVRLASETPELVLEIIKDMPSSENFRVHQDLLEAACRMPPDKAADIVPLAKRWLDNDYVGLLPERAGDLMLHLAEGGQTHAALTVLQTLTKPILREISLPLGGSQTVVRREANPRYNPWYLKRLIENSVPTVAVRDPMGTAKSLEKQLRRCLHMERRTGSRSDASHVWRPAIEDHPQNWGEDHLKTMLTVGLRQTLERAAREQPDQLRPMIESYLSDSLSVFRRLGLHILRVSAPTYQALVSDVLGEDRFAEDQRVHHEYYLLLESQFAELLEARRNRILDRIAEGPDLDRYRRMAEAATASPPSDQDVETYRRHWRLRKLAPLAGALTGHWKRRYDALVAEFGRPEHPESLAWSSGTWVGPTSPVKHDELAGMTPSDVLEYVKTFEPTGDFFDHSRAGLGQELEVVVRDNPVAYVEFAARFLAEGVHPTYAYHLVKGFHEAWKAGADLDWDALAGFFEPISLALSREGPSLRQHEMTIDDVGWVGVRMAISRFLSGALHRDDRLVPPELLPRIRDMLLRFLKDPDPSPAEEEERLGDAMDWVSIRINTGRGVAAEAFLEYALRYARINKEEHEAAAGEQDQVQRMEPCVKAAFTDMLDKEKEPSAAVHALFGQFLPNFLFLDRQWILSQVDRIFPPDAQEQRYWEAAWEGYMLYCPRVYRELYELLQPQYHRAVAALPGADTSTPMRNTAHALAQHIALSYRMGYEELEPPTHGTLAQLGDGDSKPSLLRAFLQVASDELRAAFVRGLGSSLGLEDDVPPEHWTRMRDYWEARVQALPDAPTGYETDQELSAFVSWVRGVPEDLGTLAPLLRASTEHLATGRDAHDLLAYLSHQSRSHPLPAVKMLRLLLDREAVLGRGPDMNRIYLIGAEQHIWTILENAMGADDTARESAISLINLLGERGDYTYRRLLQPRD
jgi:hypothetical protein